MTMLVTIATCETMNYQFLRLRFQITCSTISLSMERVSATTPYCGAFVAFTDVSPGVISAATFPHEHFPSDTSHENDHVLIMNIIMH
jgi:hypothetical protein